MGTGRRVKYLVVCARVRVHVRVRVRVRHA